MEPSTQPAAGAPPAARKSLRILYADDMPELRDVIRIALTRDGHAIECLANGSLALARLTADAAAFDLVITDHHMPVMNGLELVSRLRSTNAFPGPIIVFSSELSPHVHQAYAKLGVARILQKPVLPSELRQILRDL